MWDKPRLLNRIANGLYALAVLLAGYALVWIVVHQPAFALRSVEITGDAKHVTRAQVEAIVGNELKGTFFTLNLPHLRHSFEKLPWVREVRLRRHWPDRLEVNVVEHVPLARWGSAALVNVQGDVFHAAYDGKLPVFIGPPGTSREIAIQYELFRRNLSAIGAKPVMVRVTPRRAWQVKLDAGPTLELGREDIEARLARYLDVHESTVGALKRRIDYVDLRYANGFAVRIPELKGEGLPAERPARGKRTAKKFSAARRIKRGRHARSGAKERRRFL
jgi:cell division protein FtsQ